MTLHREIFGVLDLPVLRSLFEDADLKLVDIGGRDSAFPGVLPLAPFARYYVSEPEAKEAERLRECLPQAAPWRSVTIITQAIASRRGEADLHVTAKPGMSSLLEPDIDVTRRYCLNAKYEVVSVARVATLPLDEAASDYGFVDATFLKIDTQGTELDILQSGPRLVRDSLLGIHVESEFHPFYKGQALFADVDTHLRQNGFSLFSLNRTMLRRAGYREALYSKRVTAWAHCLYLREPETLAVVERESRRRDLSRLLALAVAFEHYDLSFEIVAIITRLRFLPDQDVSRLTAEIEHIARLSTKRAHHRAKRDGITDDLLGPSFRDKQQLG